jgi:hypothetical protein
MQQRSSGQAAGRGGGDQLGQVVASALGGWGVGVELSVVPHHRSVMIKKPSETPSGRTTARKAGRSQNWRVIDIMHRKGCV